MKKDEIERSYHQGTHGEPMVNVKVYAMPTAATWADLDSEFPGFHAWMDEHADDYDDEYEWFNVACEDGFEMLQQDAETLWPAKGCDAPQPCPNHPGPVKVYSAGRSGGWAVVTGLADVETWDAIAVSKWARFAKWARQQADDIPRARLWLIAANVYEPERERIEAGEQVAGDACAEYLRAVGVAS